MQNRTEQNAEQRRTAERKPQNGAENPHCKGRTSLYPHSPRRGVWFPYSRRPGLWFPRPRPRFPRFPASRPFSFALTLFLYGLVTVRNAGNINAPGINRAFCFSECKCKCFHLQYIHAPPFCIFRNFRGNSKCFRECFRFHTMHEIPRNDTD